MPNLRPMSRDRQVHFHEHPNSTSDLWSKQRRSGHEAGHFKIIEDKINLVWQASGPAAFIIHLDEGSLSTLFEIGSVPLPPLTNWEEQTTKISSDLFLYKADELEREFEHHATIWRNETAFLSSLTEQVLHPSYQRIVGMGRQAIPLLLHELEHNPDFWFWALNAITGENPVEEGATFDEGVSAWLEWGKEKGYIR